MMKEKAVKEKKPKLRKAEFEGKKKPKVKVFDLGDLVVDCKCGHRVVLAEGIKDGYTLYLLTNNKSQIRLVCEKCGSELILHFIKSKQKRTKDESVSEESKEGKSV